MVCNTVVVLSLVGDKVVVSRTFIVGCSMFVGCTSDVDDAVVVYMTSVVRCSVGDGTGVIYCSVVVSGRVFVVLQQLAVGSWLVVH